VSSLEIQGTNVTVRNVSVAGGILVTGSGAFIDHVTTQGIAISSASNVTVQYANIGYSDADSIHITSDRGSYVTNVKLQYNYIHDPRVPAGAHYDGTQVRGADGVTISCSSYEAGSFLDTFNAAIYLEDANGGTSNVTVSNNWLSGSAFSIMMDARNTKLLNNQLSGDIHWDTCYVGTRVGTAGLVSSGNSRDGVPINLCQ